MRTSGDVVHVDLGFPQGREAGGPRPAVIVTSQRTLDASPSVVHIVPLTSTIRSFDSDVLIEADAVNGLSGLSAAQCQHVRSISVRRVSETHGNVGAAALAEIRDVIGLLLDIPG